MRADRQKRAKLLGQGADRVVQSDRATPGHLEALRKNFWNRTCWPPEGRTRRSGRATDPHIDPASKNGEA